MMCSGRVAITHLIKTDQLFAGSLQFVVREQILVQAVERQTYSDLRETNKQKSMKKVEYSVQFYFVSLFLCHQFSKLCSE